ncbi:MULTISPECIES: DUF3732 domain-containing protein [unclassified Bradyrhizobium]|uniref:DUF3732 domain-containing protein n=1 Tax=unclassified Bradyrhizobium TaxID=2631580 RepID=UPI001FF90F53|nr:MULTISPECIES: DUF3732 domain-containing protein [unclassified Bradyrhizobium]
MRWNVLEIAFYGVGGRRRVIGFEPDAVNVITGASGTGKSAIIDSIDYCLGSKSCGLPFYVREHALAVAVHWVLAESHLIVGRNIPRAGKGTEQMFVRSGRNLTLPDTADRLEGPTNRDTARAIIERAFGIGDIENPNVTAVSQKGRATVRDITPYLFLSGDIIISKTTLLHDLNRPEKARDIRATMPFFLGAVDQETVLAERRLRQLEAALERLERDAKIRERSRSHMAERSMALLSQAAIVGLASAPSSDATDQVLLDRLRRVSDATLAEVESSDGDDLAALEGERLALVRELHTMRGKRRALNQAIKEASGYGTAVAGQSHKLALVQHLKLDSDMCPVCEAENPAGRAMADEIRASLAIVSEEVTAVNRLRPELASDSARLDDDIGSKSLRLREIEAQVSAIVRQMEDAVKAVSLTQQRALVVGRVHQFLEMTAQDSDDPSTNLASLQSEIAALRDRVDPEAKLNRLRDAENVVGNYATEMLSDLPTEVPATNSRLLFFASPKITLIEPARRAALTLAEIGSDQNYLAIHLALAFSLQKHFESISAPVPGLIVIDQISRPYYPDGGDEKSLEDMAKDSDRTAMRQIVRFLFEETARRAGLQVILIEHAYIEDDPQYVAAIAHRWTSRTNEKLIPPDWPVRP